MGSNRAESIFMPRRHSTFCPKGIRVAIKHRRAEELRPLRIACIVDEFTGEYLKYEADILFLDPNADMFYELSEFEPDFLFVESAWAGNDDKWRNKMIVQKKCSEYLQEVLQACEKLAIPRIFWNKEDPPSFDLFSAVAPHFDYVYTTDEDCLIRYKNELGIDAQVLQFAAQPAVHNPFFEFERKNRAVFAGSYYEKFPDRNLAFSRIVDVLDRVELKLDIFDRCLEFKPALRKGRIFPERYESLIQGTLDPGSLAKVNKGYQFQLNLNTVTQSPTMYARRVFESLASGTPVISNYSLAMENNFGNIPLVIDEGRGCEEELRHLMSDKKAYEAKSIEGALRVFQGHTFADRLESVCADIRMDFVSVHHQKIDEEFLREAFSQTIITPAESNDAKIQVMKERDRAIPKLKRGGMHLLARGYSKAKRILS